MSSFDEDGLKEPSWSILKTFQRLTEDDDDAKITDMNEVTEEEFMVCAKQVNLKFERGSESTRKARDGVNEILKMNEFVARANALDD